jgi:hypothetical protein
MSTEYTDVIARALITDISKLEVEATRLARNVGNGIPTDATRYVLRLSHLLGYLMTRE